jgi:hypothetical protein
MLPIRPRRRIHVRPRDIVATLGYPDGKSGMVTLTPDQQRTWVREHSDAFAPVNGKWGERGSTIVRLDAVDEDTLGEALTLAWQNTVAKERTRASAKSSRTAPKLKRPREVKGAAR